MDTSVEVRCPEHDLSQVLDVVLDNAIKYGGSEVTVSCTADAIIVSDNGPGLSEEELAMATTRFWRSRRSSHPRGSGLGLPIAERLVTAHGGRLSLQAGDPGLTVTIELPS
ncbi:sensor histidine kinase [Kutzneria kofuensis]